MRAPSEVAAKDLTAPPAESTRKAQFTPQVSCQQSCLDDAIPSIKKGLLKHAATMPSESVLPLLEGEFARQVSEQSMFDVQDELIDDVRNSQDMAMELDKELFRKFGGGGEDL